MLRIIETIRKKINKKRNSQGFSLVELLFSILILMLSTSVIIQCIILGVGKMETVTKSSQAQLLCAALTSSLQNELSYAQNIKLNDTDSTLQTYFSKGRGFGAGCSITMESGKIVISHPGSTPGSTEFFSLVSDADYENKNHTRAGVKGTDEYLKAYILPIKYEGGRFRVTLWVDGADSDLFADAKAADAKNRALAYSEFYVKTLSGVGE